MRSIFVVLSTVIAACTSVLAQGTASMRTHSISMPYIGKMLLPCFWLLGYSSYCIDDELQNRWFDFAGNTIINTNHQIRLTSTKQSQLGYLWSRLVKDAIVLHLDATVFTLS